MRLQPFATRALGVVLGVAGFLAMSANATAGVTYYASQSDFLAQGAILSQSNFNSYGTGVSVIGTGTVIGDVTFQSGPYGVVFGTANTSYPTVKNAVVQPNFSSVIFDVATSPTKYTMLGFLLGNALGGNSAQVSIQTNVSEYNFSVASSAMSSSFKFQGFVTSSPSEYITKFQAYAAPSLGGGAAVADVYLGSITVVPEPGSITILASAGVVAGLALVRRRSIRERLAAV